MINIENLTKSFGSQILFDRVSFKINPKERIGLVGRNGHGKTTLFNLITGRESYDAGTISIPKNYHIGHVQQHIEFTKNNVLEECMTGLCEQEKDHYWKAEKVLSGLGFSEDDMNRHPDKFSGGFQVRLNLAKILVSEPDLLLLDEPTNYLDIVSIRWVERFLADWPRELIIITHNRGMMDRIVTHISGIHRKKIRKIPGNTGKYYEQVALDEEVYEKTRIKDERRRKEVKKFISRFRAKARLANMVQSRIKTLSKTEKKDKLEKIKMLDFSFRSSPFTGKRMMYVDNVSFSYEPKTPIIKNFKITVRPKERICIIGKNGMGKTTLLKLLSAKLTPETGEIVYHSGVKKGLFEQTNIKSLVDSRTVEEEILYSHSDIDRQKARNICGAMLFHQDAALKKISVLSGGEKSRVMLGKLLATPLNLLLLDEPTNHLDMESCDALLAAIDSFDGTVIMVTHNEMFLHALAHRLIVFYGDTPHVFQGSYQDFLEKDGWENHYCESDGNIKDSDTKEISPKLNKKDIKRIRSRLVAERSKALKPLRDRILQTEQDIEKNENMMDKFNTLMQTASLSGNGEEISQLSKSIHTCNLAIKNLFDELEKTTSALESQETIFKLKMEKLESE